MKRERKLFYISPRDVRKNRSDAVHIMLSCQGFAEAGIKVTLLTPKVERVEYHTMAEEVFKLYGIEDPDFRLIELSPARTENKNQKSSAFLSVFSKLTGHLLFVIKNLHEFRQTDQIIYSKCFISTVPYILFKKLRLIKSKIVFETITPKNSWLHRFIFRNSDKIISHLKYVTEDVKRIAGITGENIFEPSFFTQSKEIIAISESKQEIRSKLGWESGKTYVLYAGKTGEKTIEVDYFISAAKICPELTFIIVGANENSMKRYQARIQQEDIDNLLVFPFQPLTEYYRYVLAADILVGYYPATEHNKYHLSPGKSGIYLASKNPCIFSDLPSLRSIFPEQTVFYARPDSTEELAKTIRFVLGNQELAKRYATNAYEFAQNSNYNSFTRSVAEFIYLN